MFALGSVLITSGHLRTQNGDGGSESSRDYSIIDKNETAAIHLVPNTIITLQILFAGKVRLV